MLGGHQSDNTMSTISSKTRSHHSNPGSTLMIRNDEGETSKQRNVTQEKGTAEERQQVVAHLSICNSFTFLIFFPLCQLRVRKTTNGVKQANTLLSRM